MTTTSTTTIQTTAKSTASSPITTAPPPGGSACLEADVVFLMDVHDDPLARVGSLHMVADIVAALNMSCPRSLRVTASSENYGDIYSVKWFRARRRRATDDIRALGAWPDGGRSLRAALVDVTTSPVGEDGETKPGRHLVVLVSDGRGVLLSEEEARAVHALARNNNVSIVVVALENGDGDSSALRTISW